MEPSMICFDSINQLSRCSVPESTVPRLVQEPVQEVGMNSLITLGGKVNSSAPTVVPRPFHAASFPAGLVAHLGEERAGVKGWVLFHYRHVTRCAIRKDSLGQSAALMSAARLAVAVPSDGAAGSTRYRGAKLFCCCPPPSSNSHQGDSSSRRLKILLR